MMKRTPKSVAALALAGALWACAPEPAELYQDAQAAFDEANFQSARVSLIAALEVEPNNVDMQVLLVRTLVSLGNGEGAILRLSALPKDLQEQPEMALLRAEAEVLRGKFDAAIAVVDGREDAPADRIRALAYVGKEDLESAAIAFETGLNRETQDKRLLSSYARFELASDSPEQALALVQASLELDSKYGEGLLTRAAVYERQNELAKALADYDTALELQPANFDARAGKAQVLARMGQSEEAKPLLAELKQQAPNEPKVAFIEARIAGNANEWQRVRDILQKQENAVRGNADMTALYSEALIALDVPRFALNFLKPELERRPNSRVIRLLYARAQLASGEASDALATMRTLAGRPDASEAELDVAIASAKAAGSETTAESFERRKKAPTPEWVGGELAKADRALRNRQWASAEASYKTILKRVGGTNAMVLNNLAYAQDQQGNLEAALKNALAAAKLQPDNAAILDTAGWLLVQSGSNERGIEMLSKAAKLDPKNPNIASRLTKARGL